MCLPQPAHLLQLLGVDVVDDRTGGKEEQGLEEGMVHQMEQTGGEGDASGAIRPRHRAEADTEQVGTGTERQEHVAQLADGRIGENALDRAAS